MLIIYTDGASFGNPGPMGIGVAFWKSGKLVKEMSEYIGKGTNNTAEYTAVLRALEVAKKMGEKKITVRSDSELLVRQFNGEYKVKKPHLKRLKGEIDSLIEGLDVEFEHIPRERNKRADALSKKAAENED